MRLRLYRRARDRRRRRVGHAAVRRRRARGGATRSCDALEIDPAWLPRALESPEVDRRDARRRAGRRGRGRPGRGRARRRRRRRGRAGVGRARHLAASCSPRWTATPRPRGARARVLPRGAGGLARDGRDAVGAAGSLRWLRDASPGRRYGELRAEAAAWEPGRGGPARSLPYLAGERTPHADPDARGAFTGLSLRHDRGALVRAVLEGVAFGLRDSLDLVAELGGAPDARPRLGRRRALASCGCEIVASVLEMPLERTAVDEGAAFGAALLGGVAAGVWGRRHEAVAACVRVRAPSSRSREWIEPYREARERFRALYPALRGFSSCS